MSQTLHLLLPIPKEAFENPANTRKAIDLLVQKGLVSLDMPTEVWIRPYDSEQDDYGAKHLPPTTLGQLRDALEGFRDEIVFDVGFSRYSWEYKDCEEQGRLPGINVLTEQLQDHMEAFCEEHDIDETLDVYGNVSIGFLGQGGEDDLGVVRGIGVFCDGDVASFMEDAGYLDTVKELEIYALLQELAAIYGEKETALQFRG